ncbi:L-lactate MFS transporter [Paramaledivibacter caminithermalis]|uniref:MFS transporter, OFA family, oxalate/formate antiporter n=1 Tax=Paramaledivibacter caminithermalis (strain DSM 15212 / CIP 107654 / DViRD3) TaxID=1121301 RepID=A0A1M6TEM9_PARC5|nr:OFA family MFS transporter [Paramaledivibacter caminithermalis]SHK55430.1 MFS transporter, OFA family, oxalate/formate antiporter [Paramaledivibacter caminithermalis DSM 15212]
MNDKTINRWFVVFGAVLLQMCIGAIYTWSLFNQPLMDKFSWEKGEVVLTYSIAIFIFAFSTIFSGRLQDRIGPRKVAIIGAMLYGGGLMLASTATSIIQLYIYYGVIAGAGVGFAYVCPLSTCVKWFPEKKGFITGIAVGAFGLGSLVFKSLIQYFIATNGVSSTFFYLGMIYTILGLIGANFLILPPIRYNSSTQSSNTIKENNFKVGEMVKTKSFYLIWIMYFFGCMSGLLVIGLAKDIGMQLAGLEASVAANAVAMIALFNAGGRLIWGALSDKLGRIKVVTIMFIITAISMITMSVVTLSYITFFACLAGIAFCFGGFLAVFPTITGEFFGIKNLGANYGIIYQAYGAAALAGPIIVARAGGLKPTFLIAAFLAIVGASLTFVVRQPKTNNI